MASDAPPNHSFFLSGTKTEPTPTPNPTPIPTMINLDFTTPQNHAVYDEDEADVDVDDDDVDNDDSTSVTVAIPVSSSTTATVPRVAPPYPIDENRKLFQRLWTDEDEIELLQGFYDYNTQRGSSYPHHHHDTTAFYDQIKKKLQLDFNRNQLVEKLRRLKKKFRNVMQKTESGKEYVFKSPHDQATFEISKKIWGGVVGIGTNSGGFNTPVKISRSPDDGGFNDEDDEMRDNANINFSSGLIDFSPNNVIGVDEKVPIRPKKRPRVISGGGVVGNAVTPQLNLSQTPMSIGVADQVITPGVATPNVIEETIRSCVSPIFKELLNGVMNLSNVARGAGGLAALGNMTMGLGFGGIGGGGMDLAAAGDERWRKQQILELEVFSKRLELVQDQIKVQLEELRGKES